MIINDGDMSYQRIPDPNDQDRGTGFKLIQSAYILTERERDHIADCHRLDSIKCRKCGDVVRKVVKTARVAAQGTLLRCRAEQAERN